MSTAPAYRLVRHRGRYSLAYGLPRKRIALGTSDLGEAEALAKLTWKVMTSPTTDKVSDLWTVYITDREEAGASVVNQKIAWKHLEPIFGYKLGNQIDKPSCRIYTARRLKQGKSSSTIKSELAFLRACLNLRYGKPNLDFEMEFPPSSQPRKRHLKKANMKPLLEAAGSPHVRLFITLAVTTGARMSAILETTWDRVDFEANMINYDAPGRHQTNKRRTEVPLNGLARAALREAQAVAKSNFVVEFEGRQIRSIKKAVARASEKAGIPCSPHVFRHTAGVWMAEANIPMQKIAQYLGHASTAITEKHYARYSPSAKDDAANALTW